jgi:spore photoproduct lyase
LTKSSNIRFLLEKPRKQTIASFSINAPDIAALWEHKTAPPESRIEAARRLAEAGYEVRLRIDPIFPIQGWQQSYEKLLYLIFKKLPMGPERITLGMPRGLRKTLMYSKNRTWAEGLTEKSGWGLKLPAEVRKTVYIFFLDKLRGLGFNTGKIALCKETVSLSQELQMDRKCNCVW